MSNSTTSKYDVNHHPSTTLSAATNRDEISSGTIPDWFAGFSALDEVTSLSFVFADSSTGKIIYTSNKFLELMKCVPDIHKKPMNIFEHFVFPEDLVELKKSIASIGKVVGREVQMIKENGEFFLGSVSVSGMNMGGEKLYLVVINDIGTQKIIEEEKQRLLEELEISKEQIEEEAGKLVSLNAQLEVSEQKLEELNAAKDRLFSIIGHDLKNPFYVITSTAEILNEDYDILTDKEKKDFIDAIGSTSSCAQKLLENLLHWARMQTGRMEYLPEILQLKRMVDNSIQLLSSQAMKKNINLIYDIDGSLIVSADKNMLDTILRNLISNAIKFTNPEGTVTVCAEENAEFVHVMVKDNGIGMSESDLKKLFRIDVNNCEIGSSKEKGTGLGLILCKEFVEKHSGKIWVESVVGEGSVFNFTIPISLPKT